MYSLPSVCVLTMKTHNSIQKKDIIIKLIMQVYFINVYMVKTFLKDIIIGFKMVAIRLNFKAFFCNSQRLYPRDYTFL